MEETYFAYILSKCRTQSIEKVCSIVSTRNALFKEATSPFNGCSNITSDKRLINTIVVCLHNRDTIDPDRLDSDGRIVYNRCKRKIQYFTTDYDALFDCIVDLNWLLASVERAKRGQVRLLVNPTEIAIALRIHLANLYESAIQDSRECLYIREAREARKRFFIGRFKFQYDESRKYTSMDEGFHFIISHKELDELEADYKDNSACKMALFYGLTATAALAEDIRRFG